MTFGIKVFSKRERERLGDVPDYYIYDQAPEGCRNKLSFLAIEMGGAIAAHIWSAHSYDSRSREQITEDFAREVCYEMCKTHGWIALPGAKGSDARANLSLFVTRASLPLVLDSVEVLLHVYRRARDACYQQHRGSFDQVMRPDEAEASVNAILKEHAIGYELIDSQFVRVDTDFLHREAVKEAIFLLKRRGFEGPLEELRQAIVERDKGEPKQAISESAKAFESTMKAVLRELRVPYDDAKANASALIRLLIEAKFLSPQLETFAQHMGGIFGSGLPALRNRQGGHGQGPVSVEVEPSYVNLAVHLSAVFIVFAIRRLEEMGK